MGLFLCAVIKVYNFMLQHKFLKGRRFQPKSFPQKVEPKPMSNTSINVLIPFHNKVLNYLVICLATLKEAIKRYDDVTVYLYNTSRDDVFPELAKDIPNLKYRSTKTFPSIEVMYGNIIPQVFKQMRGNFLTIIEADAVIHPDIFPIIARMISEIDDLGYGSVFNTPFHRTEESFDWYVRKRSLGFFGSIIRKDMWRGLGIRGITPGVTNSIDWSYCGHIKKQGLKLYCTKRSYIEHMGFSGKHQRNLSCTANTPFSRCIAHVDRAINFLN